jgi:hypothetical protein
MNKLLIIVSLLSIPVSAQQVPAPATQDLGARQLIQHTIQVLATSQEAAAYKDFQMTGMMTLEGSSESRGVAVFARGLHDLRFEFEQQDGTIHRSLTRGDGKNAVQGASGRTTKINRNARAGTEVPLLPLPGLLSDLLRTAGRIEEIGTEPVNGRPAHHLKIFPTIPPGIDSDGVLAAHSTIELFIDSQSFVVLRIAHIASDPTGRRSLARAVNFDDYRWINGVKVPFSLEETLEGQKTWSISIVALDFTRKFNDKDFEL